MKKIKFYVSKIPVKNTEPFAYEVDGYDIDGEFGMYHDKDEGWYVIDYASGLAVYGPVATRKCALTFTDRIDAIRRVKAADFYDRCTQVFNQLLDLNVSMALKLRDLHKG